MFYRHAWTARRRLLNLPFSSTANRRQSLLLVSLTSSRGVQQGDPFDHLLFALAVDQIASGMESELNVWYPDDATISGSRESVLNDVQRCITGLMQIGLKVNPYKTEIINVGLAVGIVGLHSQQFQRTAPRNQGDRAHQN